MKSELNKLIDIGWKAKEIDAIKSKLISEDYVFSFGKYKGVNLKSMTEEHISYLEWIMNSDVKSAIKSLVRNYLYEKFNMIIDN